MAEKTRYSDAELEEFRAIILEKLEIAKRDYELLRSGVTNSDGNDVADTSPTFSVSVAPPAVTRTDPRATLVAPKSDRYKRIFLRTDRFGLCYAENGYHTRRDFWPRATGCRIFGHQRRYRMGE